MREDATAAGDARYAAALARGFGALVALTFALIVLGALVRAHGAGLACPDWPLCFGEWIPAFDFQVAFEWTHRAVAGSVALLFAALAFLTLRRRETRRVSARLLVVGAALLGTQIALGGLTVLQLLAAWTVTSHLLAGNAFAATLLATRWALRDVARPPRPSPSLDPTALLALAVPAALLALQLVLGGLVASRFAGLACPEWPRCQGGVWFPTLDGVVGLQILHRMTAYALVLALALAAIALRRRPTLGRILAIAAALGVTQVGVGVANVLLRLPVEVTAAHSALAAALVLLLTAGACEALRLRPRVASRFSARELARP